MPLLPPGAQSPSTRRPQVSAAERAGPMAHWGRFLLMLLPIPALVFHVPLWIEQFTSIEFPVHLKGVVVITGASSGIGRHAALALDAGGMTVFAGVRSREAAESLLAARPSIRTILWDVTSAEQTDAAVAAVSAAMRAEGLQLAGLVNNAGISHRMPLELDSLESIRGLYDVNLFGAIRATKAFLPLMRESAGRVVFISSLAGLVAQKGSAAYSGSKFALEATADALRLELAPWQISVSIVEPGFVRTAIAQKQTGESAGAAARSAAHPSAPLYAAWVEAADARRLRMEEKAAAPFVVSSAIAHALAAPRPRTRYAVANVDGTPAWAISWLVWLLPDRLQDRFIFSRK